MRLSGLSCPNCSSKGCSGRCVELAAGRSSITPHLRKISDLSRLVGKSIRVSLPEGSGLSSIGVCNGHIDEDYLVLVRGKDSIYEFDVGPQEVVQDGVLLLDRALEEKRFNEIKPGTARYRCFDVYLGPGVKS